VYGIPSKLIIGVGVCESGFGQSKQSIKQNNYFGLRGKYVRKKKSSFKYYARPEDSMVDFCEVLASKKYYISLKGNPDPMKWTRAMAKARYAANEKRWIRLMKKSFTLID
jgi:flagellum-specific peptidoglycan hydrolase FlgJ